MTPHRIALALALLATPARAESAVVQAFHRYDLFGTWSIHCAEPPSAENPRVVWLLDRGTIVHQVSFDGRTAALADRVGTGAAVGRDRVWFSSLRDGKFFLTTTIRVIAGRIYALKSVGAGGHVFVDRGINLATGAATPINEKCLP